MSPQHRLRLTYRINCPSSVGGCPRLSSTCRSPHPFSMLQLHNLALLFAAISKGVTAATVSTYLDIVNAEIDPDGFTRDATLANGVFPGPVIRATKGDRLQIDVTDNLGDSSLDLVTSIHWHGFFQSGTNWADGVDAVTQCPIIPGESFLYNFTVPDQAGTFWYHSHYSAQYCDGLRGAMIIDDPDDPQRYLYDIDDDDTIITLADWYHTISTEAGLTPEYNSTLINGLGRYADGPAIPLAVVNVISEHRYRLRLISISCDPSFNFSIDSHTLTVIEVDGVNVQPLKVDSLEIFAGQRYSVVLTANQLIGNYWIRALPISALEPDPNFNNLTNLAILRYLGAFPINPLIDPTVNIPVSKSPLIETNLHPLEATTVPGNPTPGGADININLHVVFNTTALDFDVNGVSYDAPTVPVLLQILNGANVSELVPAGSIYGLDANKSVEISIPGGAAGGPHPVHLHGHNFHVVRSAGESTYNYDNPVIRDVVSIGTTGDNVTIRFFTDNYGPWFFHCHIDWHLKIGFAVVFAEDVPEVPAEVVPSPDWSKLCPAYDDFLNG
ncbi:laccase 14 [Russula aff. rugulosa BPL654]|nr:laccase 14 [Russula aff. rugulosa BPL654]